MAQTLSAVVRQVFVHLDSAAVVQFDAGGFQVEAGRVRGAADRDQHGMAGIALLLAVHLGEHQHLVVLVVDARHVRVVHDGDAAVFEAPPGTASAVSGSSWARMASLFCRMVTCAPKSV